MSQRVLVTGGTGFVGRHCLPRLLELGYEVHATTSQSSQPGSGPVRWHRIDLLDLAGVPGLLSRVRPTHLLHLAWYAVPGKYAESPHNFQWVGASLELLRQFHAHGGQRVVMAGSSFEYDWTYGFCSELVTPRVPTTVYGTCKTLMFNLLDAYSKTTSLSAAWARLFFLYGPYEHPGRLISSVICSLLRGEPARCSPGTQVRDYMHVQDVADALVAIMHSNAEGPVNVASGSYGPIKDMIRRIGQKLDREELVQLGALPSRPNDVPLLIADTSRLFNEVAWRPRYDLEHGLGQTIEWWKDELAGDRKAIGGGS